MGLLVAVVGLVVLAASLAGPAAASSSGECMDDQFRCDSGQYLRIDDKCDGTEHCEDGSDEWPALCSAPNTTLRVGDSLTIFMQMEQGFRGVDVQMCSPTRCSTLEIEGANVEWQLAHIAFVNCNTHGRHCGRLRVKAPDGWSKFTPGELIFEVEHRAFDLAVWLQGHPDKAVAVPVKRGQSMLRIVPFKWKSNMRVRFLDDCRGDQAHCRDRRTGDQQGEGMRAEYCQYSHSRDCD